MEEIYARHWRVDRRASCNITISFFCADICLLFLKLLNGACAAQSTNLQYALNRETKDVYLFICIS